MSTSDLVVIPVRNQSTRLPRKPMLVAGGKTLLEWTHSQASKFTKNVWIVTGDNEVVDLCKEKGITVKTTEHREFDCGTSRIAGLFHEIGGLSDWRRIVNWQVDEPFIQPEQVKMACSVNGGVNTIVGPSEIEDYARYSVVKVTESYGRCHWFSRAWMRGAKIHVGVYAMDPVALEWWYNNGNQVSSYARKESLEQLTWIEGRIEIKAIHVSKCPLSVNTWTDWSKFKFIVEGRRTCQGS